MALCPEHHERITIAFRAARRRLFFRTSSFDVTWREVHAICKERNPKYQPKPNSLWRMAWELIRV